MRWETYKQYFSYTSLGTWSMLIVLASHVLINLNSIAVSAYLAYTLSRRMSAGEEEDIDESKYNITLIGIMISAIITSFLGKYLSNLIVSICFLMIKFMQINKKLHAKMVESVLQTKLKFFEENTNGRILNRFSKDVGVLDKIVFTYLDLTDVLYYISLFNYF